MALMTTLPPSASDSVAAFENLAEPIRRWIWKQKWSALRDVQAKAIPAILAGGDVIVSARTAAGKTEAALLQLITRVLQRSACGRAVDRAPPSQPAVEALLGWAPFH